AGSRPAEGGGPRHGRRLRAIGGLAGRHHRVVHRRDAAEAARREPRRRPARGLAERLPVASRAGARHAADRRVARRRPAPLGPGGMRARRQAGPVVLVVVGLLAAWPAHPRSVAEADALYRAGRYDEAARELTDL